MKNKLTVEDWIKYMQETPIQFVNSKERNWRDCYKKGSIYYDSELHIPIDEVEDYWKNKTQWIDSEHRLKLNLLPDYRLSDEEYRKTRSEIRELMELNMVMYGRW